MPLVIADTYACAYRFVLDSVQSAEWTFGVRTLSNDPEAIAANLEDSWDELDGAISNQVALTSVAVTPLDGTSATTIIPSEKVGAFSGAPVTDSVAMVVTFRTGTAGRSHRGRAYIPGLATAALEDDSCTWKTSNVSGMKTDFEAWNAAILAASETLEHVVISRVLEDAFGVVGYTARAKIGTQRRRLTGGVIF
jgi:hypothetical protein